MMAFFNSSTLKNEPRRTRFLVSSANHRSTRLSQLELVGSGRFVDYWENLHARAARFSQICRAPRTP